MIGGQARDLDREDRDIALEVHKPMSGWEKVKNFFWRISGNCTGPVWGDDAPDISQPLPKRTTALPGIILAERLVCIAEAVSGHESRQLVRDLVEAGVGIGTNGTNRGQADDDDQSEHDCILNSGWAIFTLQELHN